MNVLISLGGLAILGWWYVRDARDLARWDRAKLRSLRIAALEAELGIGEPAPKHRKEVDS